MNRLKKRTFTWLTEKFTVKKKAAGSNSQPLFLINKLILITPILPSVRK